MFCKTLKYLIVHWLRVNEDTHSLTHSMVQDIIWKADCRSDCHNILLSLWNPKVCYHVYKSPPLDPILSQQNQVHSICPHLPKVHLNVILSHTPRSPQWSLLFGTANQNPVNTSLLSHVFHMSHPPHLPWFNHFNNICWRIQAELYFHSPCMPSWHGAQFKKKKAQEQLHLYFTNQMVQRNKACLLYLKRL
jgi:hypothetical protein